MSRKAVIIRKKVAQYQRTHAGTTVEDALGQVMNHETEERHAKQLRAAKGPYNGKGK